MIPEQKVFEKIRRLLIDDSIIAGYIADRVYTVHISNIVKPGYPAISLFLIDCNPWFNVPVMSEISLQLDLWFSSLTHTMDDVLVCVERIRALLNIQSIVDSGIDLVIHQIIETGTGGMMYEEDTKLHHLPMRYSIIAK